MNRLMTFEQITEDNGIFIDGDWVESKDQDPNGDVRLIQLADVGDGIFIDKSNRHLTSDKARELRCTYLKQGDVLVARMPDPLGRACIFPGLSTPCVTVVDVCIIRPDPKLVIPEWLAFYINNPNFRNQIKKYITGTTRQRISRGNLAKIKLNIPPIEDQKRIISTLNEANSLRKKRKQAIDLLDEYLKSTFCEIFGDPKLNPKNFELSKLSDLYIDSKNGTKCGPFGSALKKDELVQDGVPVWNMDNISTSGQMIMPFRMWITPEKYNTLKAYSVFNDDVIISRAGTVGKMCVAKTNGTPSIINTNLIRVRFGSKLLPIYFVSLMNFFKGRVGRLKTGPDGSFTHMNTGVLDGLTFPLPPMSLQMKFALIMEKTELLKQKMVAQSEELDNQFQASIQKAFN